jgi:hypothetical protein
MGGPGGLGGPGCPDTLSQFQNKATATPKATIGSRILMVMSPDFYGSVKRSHLAPGWAISATIVS